MGIGTSRGAFHEDEFALIASPWMEKPEDTPDNNVIDPTVDPESIQPITNLIIPIVGTKLPVPANDNSAKDKYLGLANQAADLRRKLLDLPFEGPKPVK